MEILSVWIQNEQWNTANEKLKEPNVLVHTHKQSFISRYPFKKFREVVQYWTIIVVWVKLIASDRTVNLCIW